MKPYQYIMGMLPVIGRDVILENLRVTRGSYSRASAVLRDIEPLIKKLKYKDPMLEALNKTYVSAVETGGEKNFFAHFINAIPNIVENISLIEDLVQGNIEESLAAKATSYKNATLLQLTEAFDFALAYGMDMASYILLEETRLIRIAEGVAEDDLEAKTAPPIAERLQEMSEAFIRVMKIVTRPVADISKALDEIPEMLVTGENYHTLSKTIGQAKLDPLDFEHVQNFNGNPILYWGRRRAEKQNARHRLAQETLNQLKLRKLNLERALAGKQDANLEKQIRVTQSRIDELQQQLEEMAKK